MFLPIQRSFHHFIQQRHNVLNTITRTLLHCPECSVGSRLRSQTFHQKHFLNRNLKSQGLPILNLSQASSSGADDYKPDRSDILKEYQKWKNIHRKLLKLQRLFISSTRHLNSQSNDGNAPKSSETAIGDRLENSKSSDETRSTDEKKKLLKMSPRLKKNPLDMPYTDNNFISVFRAMNYYLLKPSELDVLIKYKRRSPYDSGGDFYTYRKKDVEILAMEKYKSLEGLEAERVRRFEKERAKLPWLVKPQEKYYDSDPNEKKGKSTLKIFLGKKSSTVVLYAIACNFLNTVVKFVAWLITGSCSMYSECLHSAVDTLNQGSIAAGLYISCRPPDFRYPYGYSISKHISSLTGGVSIFNYGTAFSLYHGFQGLTTGTIITFPELCIGGTVLFISFLFDLISYNKARQFVIEAAKEKGMTKETYIKEGHDPNIAFVFIEDQAALLSTVVAFGCMTSSYMLSSHIPDACGSFLIAIILGYIAKTIFTSSVSVLGGRSLPKKTQLSILDMLEKDRVVRAVYDVKATEMGDHARLKAEIDYDGREVTHAYLANIDTIELWEQVQKLNTKEEFENLFVEHGEKIIDSIGQHVDRLEHKIKVKFPEIRHIDLESA